MFIPRLCSTVVLLSLFGVSIFMDNGIGWKLFGIMALFLSFFVTKEFCALIGNIGMETYSLGVCIANTLIVFMELVLFASIYTTFSKIPVMIFLGGIILLPVLIWLLILSVRNSEIKLKKVFNTVGVFFITAPSICMLIFIYCMGANSIRFNWNVLFLFFILATKIGDIGAYVTGTLSNKILKGGNHKMIPSISPGKSYEGAVGGLLFTVLLCLAFHYWIPFISTPFYAVITGILFFFFGMAGDLAESAVKRACKIKDSGHTIPGIGGVFDLVDSPMMTAGIFLFLIMIQTLFGLAFFNL